MKAIVNTVYGGPEVLTFMEVETPKPKPDEVLIKVQATTVNRTDCGFRSAKPFIVRFFSGLTKPKDTILGSEFAGDVVAIGSSVAKFKVGDAVFGLCTDVHGFGAHAEFMCVPEHGSIATMPNGASYEEAAAICEGPWLANTFLEKQNVQPGEDVLVNGASGSIGSAAVQLLCNHYGANVTAVCGTNCLDLVKSLGAERVIDYQNEDFTKLDTTFHYVVDAVGKSSFSRCKKLLKPNGIYVSTELGPRCENPLLALWTPWFSNRKVIFPIPKDSTQDIEFVKTLFEHGKFKAVIDRRYPLAETAEAYRYVETEQKIANVIINVGDG